MSVDGSVFVLRFQRVGRRSQVLMVTCTRWPKQYGKSVSLTVLLTLPFLLHSDTDCRSNLPPHPVTAVGHRPTLPLT